MELAEFRAEGTRNFIRVGDRARLLPGIGNKQSVEVMIRKIIQTASGIEVEVCYAAIRSTGHTQNQRGKVRTVMADRLERMAQTKDGKRRVVA